MRPRCYPCPCPAQPVALAVAHHAHISQVGTAAGATSVNRLARPNSGLPYLTYDGTTAGAPLPVLHPGTARAGTSATCANNASAITARWPVHSPMARCSSSPPRATPGALHHHSSVVTRRDSAHDNSRSLPTFSLIQSGSATIRLPTLAVAQSPGNGHHRPSRARQLNRVRTHVADPSNLGLRKLGGKATNLLRANSERLPHRRCLTTAVAR